MKRQSSLIGTTSAVSRNIDGSAYDNVVIVADNIDKVNTLVTNIQVIDDVNTSLSTITNAIQITTDNKDTAITKASEASESADSAAASAAIATEKAAAVQGAVDLVDDNEERLDAMVVDATIITFKGIEDVLVGKLDSETTTSITFVEDTISYTNEVGDIVDMNLDKYTNPDLSEVYQAKDVNIVSDADYATFKAGLANTSGTNTGDQDLSGLSPIDHNHDTIYEPIDTTILRSGDIGTSVQGYNENTVIDPNYVATDLNYTSIDKNQISANKLDISVITEAMGNLANAQGTISNGTVGTILTTETQLDFIVDTDSTDTDVFTFDAAANTITFKKPGSYNFTSSITLESSTNDPIDITFNLRNTSNDNIVISQTRSVEIANNDKATFPLNTLIVLAEGSEPITIKVMVVGDSTGMAMFSFTSLLASMSAIASGFASHSQLTGTSDSDVHPASSITNAPTGNLVATTVQTALDELQTDIDTLESNKLNISSFTSNGIITLINEDTVFTIDLGGL